MEYTVKYRLPGQWFWRTIKSVIGDGAYFGNINDNFFTKDVRVFDTKNGGRVEIPMTAQFVFSEGRYLSIKSDIEKTLGQPIKTNI